MADMPDAAWTRFLCLEAANAGSDASRTGAGQTIRCASNSRSVPLRPATVTRVQYACEAANAIVL